MTTLSNVEWNGRRAERPPPMSSAAVTHGCCRPGHLTAYFGGVKIR